MDASVMKARGWSISFNPDTGLIVSWYRRAVTLCVLALTCYPGNAADWSMYMHDTARSGVTWEYLAPPLQLQWVFVPKHAPQPAWPHPGKERPRELFDHAYHVAAVGDAVYFGSSADHKVYHLDA